MPIVNLFAKLLLAGMFLWSGAINKPANFAAVTGILKGKGVPMPGIALALAILLEIGGAVMIIRAGFLSPLITHIAAALLIACSLLAAVMFHKAWRLEEPVRDHGLASSPKNVGLCGGFLLVTIDV